MYKKPIATIQQVVAPTPPGGLPFYITPVSHAAESVSELPPTDTIPEKKIKYTKERAKSSDHFKR